MKIIKVTAKKCSKDRKNVIITINPKQLEDLKQEISETISWSTEKIIDESKPTVVGTGIEIKKKEETLFSNIIKSALAILFVSAGFLINYSIISNWSSFWIGGINNLAVIFIGVISIVCFALGISIFKEKDRNYIIAMFSALVSLVALIVSIIK